MHHAVPSRSFDILHAWYNNRAGRDGPKTMDSSSTEKVVKAPKRIAEPGGKLLHYGQLDGRWCGEYTVLITG